MPPRKMDNATAVRQSRLLPAVALARDQIPSGRPSLQRRGGPGPTRSVRATEPPTARERRPN
eukprot:10274515-Lingulodinium_polyedra.AAC.1